LANLPPLDELTVRKRIVNVPIIFAGSWRAKPPTKMRGHRMEVDAQAVSGESEDTIRMQTLLEFVDQMVSVGSPASAQMQSGSAFLTGSIASHSQRAFSSSFILA